MDNSDIQRLLLVSNRLPVTVEKRKGKINYRPSIGGLATGLSSFYQSYNSMWIGWCGLSSNNLDAKGKKAIDKTLRTQFKSHSLFLSKKDIRMFYAGFCNKTIWPLFHYFTDYTDYDNNLWLAYKHVNRLFSHAVLDIAEPHDIIWIHDYQLMLLPQMLRQKLPEAQIGFFLHIPFPSYEIFRLLPWRATLLKGLLGSDLIGFHTYDYVRHFVSSVRRIIGSESNYGQFNVDNRIIKIDAFPMGIDYKRFAEAKTTNGWLSEIKNLCSSERACKIILSVDRLDYTKGILQRLEAFDCFLKKYPEYKNKVTLILVAVPSRISVETYKLLKQQVDELIGRINGEHGTINWMPVWYLYRSLPFDKLVSLYNVADVALVTPIRDGMNLIAKEYIATKKNNQGVLILSEMAGAISELPEAISVNPNDKNGIADALEQALTMSEEEQIERISSMKNRLNRYNIVTWANDFMDRLSHAKIAQNEISVKQLSNNAKKQLINDYKKSKHRLIFLDYDGTLVPFSNGPDNSKPDNEIIRILANLKAKKKNEVVIISGRDKETLQDWFGSLRVALCAEHGVWVKEKKGEWHMLAPLSDEWKDEIRPMLELYVDRTPGSFIEEKSFSLAWHYRNVDPELGPFRTREMKYALLDLTANHNLVVSEGSKVIEIKIGGVNKGQATSFWMPIQSWDFIFAVGDDYTDEDLFSALPEEAYSIKVGMGISKARYFVTNYLDVRELLKQINDIK